MRTIGLLQAHRGMHQATELGPALQRLQVGQHGNVCDLSIYLRAEAAEPCCKVVSMTGHLVASTFLSKSVDMPDSCKPSVAMPCCADVSGATEEWQSSPEQAAVLTGPEFRQRVLRPDGTIDRHEFDVLWPSLRVMGRCSPQDKYTIVRGVILAYKLPRAIVGPACDPAVLKCPAPSSSSKSVWQRACCPDSWCQSYRLLQLVLQSSSNNADAVLDLNTVSASELKQNY